MKKLTRTVLLKRWAFNASLRLRSLSSAVLRFGAALEQKFHSDLTLNSDSSLTYEVLTFLAIKQIHDLNLKQINRRLCFSFFFYKIKWE